MNLSPQHNSPGAVSVSKHNSRTALVLGGGGSTGNAWLIGVVAGLLDANLDVTSADVIVGTSAGSTAAAQLAGQTMADLFAATVAGVPLNSRGLAGPPRLPQNRPVVNQLEKIDRIIASAADSFDMRRRMGAAALDLLAASDGSWQTQWRTTVASRLPSQRWPDQAVLITAVDARTGESAVFDRHSGVDVTDAIAASCASSLPYQIGDDYYIDGGFRRNENADLAAGYERVLVLSPFGGRTRHPAEWGMQLATQVQELRVSGSTVETILPDSDSDHLFGANAMDLSLRPAAARAGHNQGGTLAEQLSKFWH